MPVIGRLDQQVNDVLIEPVRRSGRNEAAPPDEIARPDSRNAPQPDANNRRLDPNRARPDERPPDDDAAPALSPEDESSSNPARETESRARAIELPVWML